jgi:hypothetical protein
MTYDAIISPTSLKPGGHYAHAEDKSRFIARDAATEYTRYDEPVETDASSPQHWSRCHANRVSLWPDWLRQQAYISRHVATITPAPLRR